MSGRKSQKRGDIGEQIARLHLKQLGIKMIEKIATPIRIIQTKKVGKQIWYRIVWSDEVSGDVRGILPDGRRVLCEVKVTKNPRLVWSTFKLHQREALTENNELNGLSLVCWNNDYGTYILQWPIPRNVSRILRHQN